MATITDTFDRANGNLGSNWQSSGVGHGFYITSNQCVYQSGVNGICYVGASFTTGSTQYAQVKVVTLPTNDYAPGPTIRMTLNGWDLNTSGYAACVSYQGAIRLQRGSSLVKTSATGAVANGDTVRIVDEGSGNIRVYVQAGSTGSFTLVTSGDFSSQYTDGSPYDQDYIGLYAYAINGSGTTYVLDDFEGGDGTGGSGASAVTGRNLLLGIG